MRKVIGINIELVKLTRECNLTTWTKKEVNIYHKESIPNLLDYVAINIKEMDLITIFSAGEININYLDSNYHPVENKRFTIDCMDNGRIDGVIREFSAVQEMYREVKRIPLRSNKAISDIVDYLHTLLKEEIKKVGEKELESKKELKGSL